MELTWQSIITAGGVLSALLLLLTTYNRVYRWTLRQKEQDEELKAIRKENTLLTYGVLACLKGMAEQGCNGPVREAIDKIEKSLNLRAHDQCAARKTERGENPHETALTADRRQEPRDLGHDRGDDRPAFRPR